MNIDIIRVIKSPWPASPFIIACCKTIKTWMVGENITACCILINTLPRLKCCSAQFPLRVELIRGYIDLPGIHAPARMSPALNGKIWEHR